MKIGAQNNSNMQSSMFAFFFLPELTFLGKFGLKKSNYQFKSKFTTYTNANKQVAIVAFTFSVLNRKYSFFGKFGPKM